MWLWFKYFVTVTDQFGFEGPHPQQRYWLIAHAAVSFACLWMYGVLWTGHVLRCWRARQRRWSGGSLFGIVLWLILSGCALYYIGSDALRGWTSILHWGVGLAAMILWLVHRRDATSVSQRAPQ